MTPAQRNQEAATLTLLIPQKMKDHGWRIGRDRSYHALTILGGRTYTLYGTSFEAVKGDLKKWIWLVSD